MKDFCLSGYFNKESISKTIDRIINFIVLNGWEEIEEDKSDYRHFYKDNNYGIDIGEDEIVIIAEEGDIKHIRINCDSFYTVIGYLIYNRLLALDLKYKEKDENIND